MLTLISYVGFQISLHRLRNSLMRGTTYRELKLFSFETRVWFALLIVSAPMDAIAMLIFLL